ncbi:nucleoside diphosphate kinase regulator [Planctomyces sp. SH-PL14]|uniref:nucleoside diphosphate kinase regulator n=1 Tax=Planctomyces sp. SH-PL14 TaxID=1632864 RepID=UPI00078CD06C|nr:nucleoside diphosphate kinase regulator [Planctomyces sp. SH-PL14]AMV16984.1 Regulator of nucleoside diphosphate kinase [Planctomyces sp. SH-PL14]
MSRPQILLTVEDYNRLRALLTSRVAQYVSGSERLAELRTELQRARVVESGEVPADVVTMNSIITFRDLDTDELETYMLVYPGDADISKGRLSVLAPIGTAILGFRVGDEVRWGVPVGWRKLRIETLVYQPERGGTDVLAEADLYQSSI